MRHRTSACWPATPARVAEDINDEGWIIGVSFNGACLSLVGPRPGDRDARTDMGTESAGPPAVRGRRHQHDRRRGVSAGPLVGSDVGAASPGTSTTASQRSTSRSGEVVPRTRWHQRLGPDRGPRLRVRGAGGPLRRSYVRGPDGGWTQLYQRHGYTTDLRPRHQRCGPRRRLRRQRSLPVTHPRGMGPRPRATTPLRAAPGSPRLELVEGLERAHEPASDRRPSSAVGPEHRHRARPTPCRCASRVRDVSRG